jgi:hypothetical protein
VRGVHTLASRRHGTYMTSVTQRLHSEDEPVSAAHLDVQAHRGIKHDV